MSNDKKQIVYELHFPLGKKPKEKSHIFRTQNDEFGDYDKRAKYRVNMDQFLKNAEKTDGKVICHANVVAKNIADDFEKQYGGINPQHFRFGCTPVVKEHFGEDYRLVVTLAYKEMQSRFEARNTQKAD